MTQNLAKMTFKGLMGNLNACEVQMIADAEGSLKVEPKLEAKKPKEDRDIAFKAWKAHHGDSRARQVESSDSDSGRC